jgi:hypothetical protein
VVANSMKKKYVFTIEVLQSDVRTLMKAGISNVSMLSDILAQIRTQQINSEKKLEKNILEKKQLCLWG